MNERKLKRIFEAARNERAPEASPDFHDRVMEEIGRAPVRRAHQAPTLFDQLNFLFPRVAWAAVGVIALCVAGDFAASAFNLPSLTDGVAQISNQWLFNANGF